MDARDSFGRSGYGREERERRSRSRERERGRDRDRDRDRDRRDGGGYRDRSRERDRYSGGERRYRSYRHSEGERGHYRDTRSESPPPKVRPRTRLPPMPAMKSFRNFISTLEGKTSEEADKLYKEYQLQYTEEASTHFFENNKYEEWFREKYDPLYSMKQAEEIKLRARKESVILCTAMRENTLDTLSSVRLFGSPSNPNVPALSGHHLDGHVNRTLYLTNIPAACNRALLTNAVTTAITSASLAALQQAATNGKKEGDAAAADTPEAKVERISLAEPTWSHRGSHFNFDRVAWVTLASGSDTQLALKALRALRIVIPEITLKNPDESAPPSMTFRLSATSHVPKALTPLSDFMSSQDRISYDERRAVSLAVLLDEDRAVSEEYTLAALLSDLKERANIDDNLTALTSCDILDIAIAYLRRVHLFVYYTGKPCRNEANLLSIAPSVVGRSVPPFPPVEKEDEKKDDQDGTDETKGPDEYNGKTIHSIVSLDKRVSEYMEELKKRLEQRKSDELTSEEKDAKTISEAQDSMEEVVEMNCIVRNGNDKVRCAVAECQKLFKGKEFLKKHIQKKHPNLYPIAEPYMKSRFENLDITVRQLPLLAVELDGGRIDERNVKEVVERALNETHFSIKNEIGRGEKRRHSNDFPSLNDRDYGGDNRYGSDSGFRPRPPPFQAPAPDPNARTLNAYRDVDAPIAVTSVDSDFGVTLPPPKKRKLLIKKK